MLCAYLSTLILFIVLISIVCVAYLHIFSHRAYVFVMFPCIYLLYCIQCNRSFLMYCFDVICFMHFYRVLSQSLHNPGTCCAVTMLQCFTFYFLRECCSCGPSHFLFSLAVSQVKRELPSHNPNPQVDHTGCL